MSKVCESRAAVLPLALQLRRHGDGEPERGAVTGLAVDGDETAVCLHDATGDEQAEPGAARGRPWQAIELLEERRLMLGGNAGPLVMTSKRSKAPQWSAHSRAIVARSGRRGPLVPA